MSTFRLASSCLSSNPVSIKGLNEASRNTIKNIPTAMMHSKVTFLLILAQFSLCWSNPSDFSPQYLYMRLMTDRLQMTDMSFANTGTLASAPDLTFITGQW